MPPKQSSGNGDKSSPSGASNGSKRHSDTNAIDLLKTRHSAIRQQIKPLTKTGAEIDLSALRALFTSWIHQSELESDILIPALLDGGLEGDAALEAAIEIDIAALLMADIATLSKSDQLFRPGVRVLTRMMTRIINMMEDKRKGVFAKAKASDIDLDEIGKQLKSHIEHLESAEDKNVLEPLPRYLRSAGKSRSEKEMTQMRGNERERDERGRFVEDDDRHRRLDSQRRSSMRTRDDDDDYRRSSSSDRRRMDDNDNDDGRGWYGDSRGHAQAARRGWETRRSSGSGREDYGDDDRRGRNLSSRYDDDDRGSRSQSSRYDDRRGQSQNSRYDDDDRRSRSRGGSYDDDRRRTGGWFGDSEGHAEAARRGWDNPDHGRSGWFGDSEGHSEASRRGWDERRSNDDDDDYDRRRSSSSSRRR